MDFIQTLTWVMTAIGLTGFVLVGKKLWWAWFVNLAVQILWIIYALVTGQPAFLASAAVFSIIFGINAYKWTKEHLANKKILRNMFNSAPGTTHLMDVSNEHPPQYFEYKLDPEENGMVLHNAKLDGSPAFTTPGDNNLVKHARAELERTGEDPEVIEWYCRVIREFSSFGHSGGSASATAVVLEELLRFRPLGPLTNDPAEWIHHGPNMWDGENGIWQNTRDGRAFSHDGGETYKLVGDPGYRARTSEVYTTACNLCEGGKEPLIDANGKCPGCKKVIKGVDVTEIH